MEWLMVSIVASVVLTIVLNVAIRLWPGGADRAAERVDRWAAESTRSVDDGHDGGVRVVFPWKAMLIGSIVLTIALNVALLVLR